MGSSSRAGEVRGDMDIQDVSIGKRYLWLMPTHPETKRRFRYLQDVHVDVVAKTEKRVTVRLDYGARAYHRVISTVNLLELPD